jgi:hypothetical protein
MEMLTLIPFNEIQPSKLLLGLSHMDYVAVGPGGEVLGRGRNKEAILQTPGATGYFSLSEAAAPTNKQTPNFDEKPWGSVGEVQTVPGWPLIEPVKINRPDLVEDKDGKIEAAVNEFKAARSKKTKKAK